jgi:sporulation protein YlmC with PRC-barrel domain
MLLTELRKGTHIVDSRGNDLGKIERFVVDPADYRVTHVVIEKGAFLPRQRVAPVEALESIGRDDHLTLRKDLSAEDLPPFEERHYLDIGSDLPADTDEAIPYPASTWAFPTVALGAYPAYPAIGPPPVAMEVTRNVPEGSLVVSEGTEVLSRDGETIGRVKEVGTVETGELAYVIVDPGWVPRRTPDPGSVGRRHRRSRGALVALDRSASPPRPGS